MEDFLKKRLIEIVGKNNFSDSIADIISASYDATSYRERPVGVVWPVSAGQVSEIMKLASEYSFPVTPRGAGTGLTGAAVPAAASLSVDMSRMNKIIEINIPDRMTVVQPGVVYADLEYSLKKHGFFFPPDPASSQVCTIGGNVATNAGGIRGAKYGTTKDYVMALEVVLADGRIMRTGTSCIKSSSGYDLTKLFVGSEGTLGIITEITLKILPEPKFTATGTACFSSAEDAGKAVSGITSEGIIPSALEIFDSRTIRILREHGKNIPDVNAMLLIETDGTSAPEADGQMLRIKETLEKHAASEIYMAGNAEEAAALWELRKSVSGIVSAIRPANFSEDITVPVSVIPEALAGIEKILEPYDLVFAVYGHAGDGNLHPKIVFDPESPSQKEALAKVVPEIFALACSLRGTLTGEHGIGIAKAEFMGLEHDAVSLEMMQAVKNAFDPGNILNPGKMGLRSR